MLRLKSGLFAALFAVCCGVSLCAAQAIAPDDAAAIGKVADQFIERLHQSLDVFSENDLFAPNIGTLYRDFPGDFLAFANPRMAKTLLLATDGATLNSKLLADWNLAYLSSLFMNAGGSRSDPLKTFPAEFVKLAKKSDYLKPFMGLGQPVTMSTRAELNRYLAEADPAISALRHAATPEILPAHSAWPQSYLPTLAPPGSMGFDACYMVRRESLVLVIVDMGGQWKIVTLAAPES
jgi:hypothetical protein